AASQGLECLTHCLGVKGHRGQSEHLLSGFKDMTIARAAAQVPGQSGADLRRRRAPPLPGVYEIERPERHDEARCAEPALRTVTRHHRCLHGMQSAVALTQMLYCEQRLAVEGRHELHTGIDRLHGESITLQLAENDGAGTAVALGAAFFRASLPEIFTQKMEDRLGRGDMAHSRDLAIQRKRDAVAGRW